MQDYNRGQPAIDRFDKANLIAQMKPNRDCIVFAVNPIGIVITFSTALNERIRRISTAQLTTVTKT